MHAAETSDSRNQPRHSIAVVSRRTGLSQLVLRAWERRYAAVVPSRTPTGRRLYTDRDIERLVLLRLLTEADHRIGDVANLPLAELQELASEDDVLPPVRPAPRQDDGAVTAPGLLDEALAAISTLDAQSLESILSRATLHLSKPQMRNDLILPLLQEVGLRWQQGTLRIAHEHMASAIVRTFLSSLNARQSAAAGAPVMVVATPPRNLHELGALLAVSHGLEAGWDVLYLGADVPAEDIAVAVADRGARAVFLSLVYPAGDPVVVAQLELLRQLVGPEVAILAAGRAAASYRDTLQAVDARMVVAPAAFDNALREILI